MATTASPGEKSLEADSTTVPAASMPGVCGNLRVDARVSGRREPVLVVERRELHVDQQVSGGQVGDVALDDAARKLPVFGLLDPERAERRHLFSFAGSSRIGVLRGAPALRPARFTTRAPPAGAGSIFRVMVVDRIMWARMGNVRLSRPGRT